MSNKEEVIGLVVGIVEYGTDGKNDDSIGVLDERDDGAVCGMRVGNIVGSSVDDEDGYTAVDSNEENDVEIVVGMHVGKIVGLDIGSIEGCSVGVAIGRADGRGEGMDDGPTVEISDGKPVGCFDGAVVGIMDGNRASDDGSIDGVLARLTEGLLLGVPVSWIEGGNVVPNVGHDLDDGSLDGREVREIDGVSEGLLSSEFFDGRTDGESAGPSVGDLRINDGVKVRSFEINGVSTEGLKDGDTFNESDGKSDGL